MSNGTSNGNLGTGDRLKNKEEESLTKAQRHGGKRHGGKRGLGLRGRGLYIFILLMKVFSSCSVLLRNSVFNDSIFSDQKSLLAFSS
jgi:hypothetical protein